MGIYDETIVTAEGEQLFGPWDDYAAKLLLQQFGEFKPIQKNDEMLAWHLPGIDYSALKLFALSVLWRAHASSQLPFQKVNLGVHEPIIRGMLLEGNPGGEEEYSVCIARWVDQEFGPVFMDPFLEKYGGVNFYRFYCGRYVLYVKVDKQKTCAAFSNMQLAPGRDLFLIPRELKTSKEWPIMVGLVKANHKY